MVPLSEVQRIVIVHCRYHNKLGKRMRIWNSTVMIDQATGSKSKLLHAENIAIAPAWMPIELEAIIKFTLIFSQLPKTCSMFDLVEEYSEHGRFQQFHISRNGEDIYDLNIGTTPLNFWH